jgi:hypothetical protein
MDILIKIKGGKPVDQTLYRSMIGSLLYLTASKPDIMFSVCMRARFQANSKEVHLGTLSSHQALAFGIPMELDFNSLAFPIRIIRVARLIGKAPPEGAICLVDH